MYIIEKKHFPAADYTNTVRCMNKRDSVEVATVLYLSCKEKQQYGPVVQNRSTEVVKMFSYSRNIAHSV